MMRTRSQNQQPSQNTVIDFDEASKCWLQNKRRLPNSTSYEYVCGALCKNGNFCQKRPVKNSRDCALHFQGKTI